MGQYSHSERDGHLLVVTINRPEVYNACHPMANEELSAEFDRFARAEDLIPAPDCGMKYLSREIAFGKLKALADGAAIVRRVLA